MAQFRNAASALLLALAGGAVAYSIYRRDMLNARRQITALKSTVAQTALGPIEFRSDGSGPPVLVIHGIWGGFDQGLLDAGGVLDRGFRRIVVSRFGYLRSPMPDTPSVKRQAELIVALLDHLGIARAAVMAHSAGSSSALQLAIEHPERVTALVLVSPNAPGPVDVVPPPRPIAEVAFRASFLFWILVRYFPKALYGIMGVPAQLHLTRQSQEFAARMARSILPSALRAEGALFDAYMGNPSINSVPVEKVQTPTLVVAAKDDPLALFANSAKLAARIPGSTLLAIENGGHMLLDQSARVEPEIAAFIRDHSAAIE